MTPYSALVTGSGLDAYPLPALRYDDAQLLAATEQATRHRDGHPPPAWVILEHLVLPADRQPVARPASS
jgi:hypothetical protein